VLIPFGLFGKTAFAAERVLGNVISSGVKVLVLAVIVGIGSTLFSQFTSGFGGNQPGIEDAMAMVLAALSLLGLGIFGPGIANGIVSGGPQLGAGAAVGTGLAAGGIVAAGAAGAAMGGRGRGRCARGCGPRQCVSCRRCIRRISRGRDRGRPAGRSFKYRGLVPPYRWHGSIECRGGRAQYGFIWFVIRW
jgi:TrbL/VirB6 plasmid conjugal transfer protein